MIALRKNKDYKETLVYGDVIPFERERHNLMAVSYTHLFRKSLVFFSTSLLESMT